MIGKKLYSKFGFDVRLLTKDSKGKAFKILAPNMLSKKGRHPSLYAKDRRVLKNEILFALTKDNYNPIGLYKQDKLIGISFSSVQEDDGNPWLGYFFIDTKYKKTKAMIVLLNYLINHLYKGFRIRIGHTDTSEYGKLIKKIPIPLGTSVFADSVAERVSKVCGEYE
jgi:hypothetical protein